ncbi:MAG: Uma2 family endonuclease [Planctomycetaceae bacterium]
MATVHELLTAEEYFRLPEDGSSTELVRGVVIPMPPTGLRHGYVCSRSGHLLQCHLDEHDIGRVFSNDAGVVTERDPDTVRGGDVLFYSYERLPKEQLPTGYADIAPDVVFEVLSPSDRWTVVLAKILEYLNAGVKAVCVLDPASETAHLYYPDRSGIVLSGEDELTLPEPLDGFRSLVRRFFE